MHVDLGGVDPRLVLRGLTFLAGDPTVRLAPGHFSRATSTPLGAGRIDITWADGSAQVRASGDGAPWLLERAEGLLGMHDDVSGFEPQHPGLRTRWRQQRGDRIPRTATLWHDLAWTIVQQRINSRDAAAHWRRFVTGLGTPLGDLIAPPQPEVVAAMPYERFHSYGIERQRSSALREAASAAVRLGREVDGDAGPVLASLGSRRGIGPWTLSWIGAQTFGDPDAVIVGDYGIPTTVCWFLTGAPVGDDARMVELLEEYRPHRQRVLRLTFGAPGPPRRAPRARPHDIRGR